MFTGWRFWSVIFHFAKIILSLRGHDRGAILLNVLDLWIHVKEEPMSESAPWGIGIVHDQRQTARFGRHFLKMNRRNTILAVLRVLIRNFASICEGLTGDSHKTPSLLECLTSSKLYDCFRPAQQPI